MGTLDRLRFQLFLQFFSCWRFDSSTGKTSGPVSVRSLDAYFASQVVSWHSVLDMQQQLSVGHSDGFIGSSGQRRDAEGKCLWLWAGGRGTERHNSCRRVTIMSSCWWIYDTAGGSGLFKTSRSLMIGSNSASYLSDEDLTPPPYRQSVVPSRSGMRGRLRDMQSSTRYYGMERALVVL